VPAAAFWALSPREVWREFEAARLRRADARDRDIVAAWRVNQIRVLTENHKRLPDLEGLLRKAAGGPAAAAAAGLVGPDGRPAPAAQKAALEAIGRKFGIPVRRYSVAEA